MLRQSKKRPAPARRPRFETLEARLAFNVDAVPSFVDLMPSHRGRPTPEHMTIAQDSQAAELDALQNKSWRNIATLERLGAPSHGTVSYNNDTRRFVYTPNPGFTGIDQFDYAFSSLNGALHSDKVFVNVVQPFVAVDDWFRIDPESDWTSLDVLRNELGNVPGQWRPELTIIQVGDAAHGTIEIASDGKALNYRPETGFSGLEEVTYRVRDSAGHELQATVKIRVAQLPTDYYALHQADHYAVWPDQLEHNLRTYVVEQIPRWSGEGSHPIGGFWIELLGTSSFQGPTAASGAMVDADIVRMEGDYLFAVMSGNGDRVVVIDTKDAANPQKIADIDFGAAVMDLFVAGDQLFVLSHAGVLHRNSPEKSPFGHNEAFVVSEFDLSEPSGPSLRHETLVEGFYRDAKFIGDMVYVVVDQKSIASSFPEQSSVCVANGDMCFYETADQYLTRVNATIRELSTGDDALRYVTYSADGSVQETGTLKGENAFEAGKRVNIAQEAGSAVISFATSDDSGGPEHAEFLPTEVGTVYATPHSIYLAPPMSMRSSNAHTEIYKLELAGGGTFEWVATGTVPDRILNQFSLSEHEGFLRVVSGDLNQGGTHISVLEQRGDRLTIVGSIENLAPLERLYSSRMNGDSGYVVTFGSDRPLTPLFRANFLDPLYTLDLSDPYAPRIVGELTIPGYSQYLQMIDGDHLLGIGRDANEQTGADEEVQVQLFDVGDPSNPELLSRYSFDEAAERGWSPLRFQEVDLDQQQAISYFPELKVLALPLFLENAPSNGNGETVQFLHVSAVDGISRLAELQLTDVRAITSVRSLHVQDSIYVIAGSRIYVLDAVDPSVKQAELNLARAIEQRPERLPPWDITVWPELQTAVVLPWHDPENPLDVNRDGFVTPLDVLAQINFINRFGTGSIADLDARLVATNGESGPASRPPFDVDNDQHITPMDVLRILNALNVQNETEDASESESALDVPSVDSVFATPTDIYGPDLDWTS